jgi:hypothetical protein
VISAKRGDGSDQEISPVAKKTASCQMHEIDKVNCVSVGNDLPPFLVPQKVKFPGSDLPGTGLAVSQQRFCGRHMP